MTLSLFEQARLDDIAFYGHEPHAAYERIRRESPVFYYEPGNFWALSKWSDIRFAGMNTELFSSEGPVFISEWRHPELFKERSKPLPDARSYFMTDPPTHKEFRQQLNPCLMPPAIAKIESTIRKTVRDALAAIPDGEVVNAVEVISTPTPVLVIADLLGVPREDHDKFVRLSNSHIALRDTDPASERGRELLAQSRELLAYMSEMQKDRATAPRDDIISFISRMTMQGEPLSPGSQALIAYQLLIAGNETIRSAISGGLLVLAQRQEQWLRLREDPGLAVPGADEVLRWTTPALHFGQIAKADIEMRDKTIRRGDFVVELFDSGNRDEEAFENGAEFDIGRKRNLHLTFAHGEHFCPGSHLARMELRIVLDELARTFRGWDLAGTPVRPASMIVNALTELPLIFHRR
jgi:cholest-4-en-3-one 26-monooxygenase